MLTSDRSSTTNPYEETMLFSVPPSISELPYEIPYDDTRPSTSYMQQDRELLACQDQSTQTKWIYESKWGMGNYTLRAITWRGWSGGCGGGGGNAFHGYEISQFVYRLSC